MLPICNFFADKYTFDMKMILKTDEERKPDKLYIKMIFYSQVKSKVIYLNHQY